jgi:hypothetical protein
MKRTKLYRPEASCNYGKPWAWASGFYWVEGKMDILPPGQMRDDFREFCEVNWKRAPGIHIDAVGSQWPDWLGGGGGPPPFFVSERVVDGLDEEGIAVRRAVEFPIAEILSPVLKQIPPPRYFVLEADFGIDLVEVLVDVPIGRVEPGDIKGHPAGGTVVQTQRRLFPEYFSWNGAPLFAGRRPPAQSQDRLQLFCDHRVTFLAMKKSWTNFEAKEAQVV